MNYSNIILLILAINLSNPAFADEVNDIVPPVADTQTPGGVGVSDGWFRLRNTDLEIGNLKFERFTQGVSEKWQNLSAFGMLMTHNYDIYTTSSYVAANKSDFPNVPQHYHIVVHLGDKSAGVFSIDYPYQTGFISNHNVDSNVGILSRDGSNLIYTDSKTGDVYRFNSEISANPAYDGVVYGSPKPLTQRVEKIEFKNGRVQKFSYDSSGRLKLLEDSTGYALVFDYGSNGMVSAACGIALAYDYVDKNSTCSGRSNKVSYTYESILSSGSFYTPVLSSFTDVTGATTSYQHVINNHGAEISCVKLPGSDSCQFEMADITMRSSKQILKDSGAWQVTSSGNPFYMNAAFIGDDLRQDPNYISTVTNPDGKSVNYQFFMSAPLSYTDENGNTTKYKWCCSRLSDLYALPTSDGAFLTEIDYPEGNKFLAKYNGPGGAISETRWVAKPNSGLSDRVIVYNYGNVGANPVSIVDANGGQTDYEWSPAHFGLLSKLSPPMGQANIRSLTLKTWEQRYAYVKSSSGELLRYPTPIWMEKSETLCQTSSASRPYECDNDAPKSTTVHEYGANGTPESLLVKGNAVSSGNLTLRTCYVYDRSGRRISETKANANLSVCP